MRGYNKIVFCISIILLALFIEEGLCRGGRGGGGRGGSRGRSFRGGGYGGSYGGSSGGGSAGIVFGVIPGCITLSVLICVCVMCTQRKSRASRSPGVVYNGNGILSSSQSSNSRHIRLDQQPTNHVPKTAPPAYSEIGQPIFNVQSEMKTTSLNTSRVSPEINSNMNTATNKTSSHAV